jgi:hypothetical protein
MDALVAWGDENHQEIMPFESPDTYKENHVENVQRILHKVNRTAIVVPRFPPNRLLYRWSDAVTICRRLVAFGHIMFSVANHKFLCCEHHKQAGLLISIVNIAVPCHHRFYYMFVRLRRKNQFGFRFD